MKEHKVFIGGWVDAKLKSRFLKELRRLNEADASRKDGKMTQSKLLEMLLSESVTLRKKPRNKTAISLRPKS